MLPVGALSLDAGPATWQACARCEAQLAETDPRVKCPSCGGLLEVHHRNPDLQGEPLRAHFDSRTAIRDGPLASGVWRFRELVLPAAGDDVVTHPEGNTPLLERRQVSRWVGVKRLSLKHEGYNPTGSFKDRGMTVGITQACRVGATGVACASTGNTGAALAAYAGQAGLRALVVVPAGQVALGKLTQVVAYGARTLLVRGDFDACLDLVQEASRELGVYLLNSINPFRLEGQKTIVLELLQQLRWNAPDWIVLPAGNLGNTAAFGQVLVSAKELGLIARVPKLAAIQAKGAAPFAASFQAGFAQRVRVRAETIATAIRIGDPASYDRAVRAIRDTDGVVATVTDEAILDAKALIDASGVGCEPASAASVAGTRQLVKEGVIGPADTVVAVLTGHLLKDPGIVTRYHQQTEPPPARANRPIEIDPTLSEVERALRE